MSNSSINKVTVIGAGVSGITTAIALQLADYEVSILTKKHPFIDIPSSDFSSHFPAASIIPHSVNHPNILDIFSDSTSTFDALFDQNFIGIEKHRHFELFSSQPEVPDYAECFTTFNHFEESSSGFRPSHPILNISFGWYFDCLFADWGTYYPALFALFARLGGKIINKAITAESLQEIESDYIVNCAEMYGASLIGEEFQPFIYRGHLLHIPGMPQLRLKNNQKISYNFTPEKQVYSTQNGQEQDVYFYQRDDRWIFGGSRQKGTIDKSGVWNGEQVIDPILQLGESIVPEQILTLNEDILVHSFGIDKIPVNHLIPKLGYRFMGNTVEYLRLDEVEIGEKLVINNYGHGGSGVTLSWGCSLRVLQLIQRRRHIYPFDHHQLTKKLLGVI